jgi:hypothetical protein
MSIVLDGTTGITTPGLTNTGTETIVNLTTTGNTILGDASTDTLNVGNGGLVKDASGNVGVGTSSPSSKFQVAGDVRINTVGTATTGLPIYAKQTNNDQRGIWTESATTDSNGRFYCDNSVVGIAASYSTTGSYLPITFTTSATERMRIDSSGNVGIGRTPSAFVAGSKGLQVGTYTSIIEATGGDSNITSNSYLSAASTYSSIITAAASRYMLDFGSHRWLVAPSVSAGSVQTFTTAMTLDSSGNLLVGSGNASLTVGEGFKVFYNSGTNPYVGAVMSSSTNSQTNYHLYSTGASAYRFYVGLAGTVFATNTTITGISDERLKENIRDLDDGLTSVMALKPRKFDWKEGKGANTKNARGFIAQEFETVFPDMIEQWKDPAPEGEEPYKAVNANLIPTLVKAIQEQQALITTLTDRITALEAPTGTQA